MPATRWARWFRTVRPLRTSQVLWRLCYACERRWPPRLPPVPERTVLRADFPEMPLGYRPAIPADVQAGPQEVAAQQPPPRAERLDDTPPDWRLGPVERGRLAAATLHYHAWAFAATQDPSGNERETLDSAAYVRRWLADWLARSHLEALGARDLAWSAYAIATRITWWIRTLQGLGPAGQSKWADIESHLGQSLFQQAAYLHAHLEWDLRANHLLRDAVGLAWAGRFFEGLEARRWLASATRLAAQQAREQVLPDGGHFERSPMYHLQVMEDIASLALLVEDPSVRAQLRRTWAALAEYAAWLRHPDGQIALLNDAALNGASAPDEALRWAEPLGERADAGPRRGGRYFADTGLVVWHGDEWSLFFDVGPVGPEYQPGHAHADTLTLEASWRGRRLLVDPGTCAYDRDARRVYDRSTAAHNTVCVDGEDSSEVWDIFRVGRRAQPLGVAAEFDAAGFSATGSHTGYDHLPGRPRHARRIGLTGGGQLTVDDQVTGRGAHRLEGGWLLAPGWQAEPRGAGWLLRHAEGGGLTVQVSGPPSLKLEELPRPYHPEFGREITTRRLSWRLEGDLPAEVRTVFTVVR